MPHYAIEMSDGSVAVMQIVGEANLSGCIAKWPPEEAAKVVASREIDPANIPADRSFRNAWKLDGKAVVHDMAKAREIKRDEIRRLRAPLLAAQDTAYLRAMEAGDTAALKSIAARKQALRDAPADPAIDAAKTVEELKHLTPDGMKP